MRKEGMINLLKPAGMTSQNAVSMLRRLVDIRRIGHTGTLDPMAVGVLPLCIGSAARISEYLDLDEKKYRCELLLGIKTDTLDIWGELLADHRSQAATLKEQEVLAAFQPLMGNIMQLPPKYSALKVNGRRLYDYARKGEEVEIKKRPTSISKLEVLDMDLKRGRVCFDVTCAKGTYIRSMCRDVGEILGCGATMSFLLRTASGYFTLENSLTIEELQAGALSLEEKMCTTGEALGSLGRLSLKEGRGQWFSNGGYLIDFDVTVEKLPFSEQREAEPEAFEKKLHHLQVRPALLDSYCVYEGQTFLGVAVYLEEEKKYICDKVFGK